MTGLLAVLVACGPQFADPYSETVLDDARIHSQGDVDVRSVTAPLDFRDGPFASATLTVDLRSTCFPFEQWDDDPPPPGHNWPASCDAFDRAFEVYLDPPGDTGGPPAFELLHAATPFGGPLSVELDVTDLANARPGAHELEVFISTSYDTAGQVSGSEGGWNVSVTLEAEPGEPPRNVLAAIPLYRGVHVADDGDVDLPFTTPEGATEVRVDYRATGHGGGPVGANCIGPAEEFCSRRHRLRADADEFERWDAWREDCDSLCTMTSGGPFGQYCLENPCGAEGSVRAPRANWCPGAVTEPQSYQRFSWNEPGEHSFGFTVDGMSQEGTWRISAAAFVYGSASE